MLPTSFTSVPSPSSRIAQHVRALSALLALCGLAACADSTTSPTPQAALTAPRASGGISGGGGGGTSGGGGGGGGVQTPSMAGNWVGTISTPFGVGAFTLRLGVSGTSVSGSAHFGAPIFDATLSLVGSLTAPSQLSATLFNGEGSLPLTGTMSADGRTITGTVIQGPYTYNYLVTRQ